MKKKGFTLIELLAVMIILVVIALITIPLILGVIENAKKQAFLDSAYGILSSTDLSYLKANEQTEKVEYPIHYKFENGELQNNAIPLNFKGDKPQKGDVLLYKNGQVYMVLWDGKYCVEKQANESSVTFKDFNEFNCVLPADRDTTSPELTITGNNKWILVGSDFNVFENNLYSVTDVGTGVERVEAIINEESITNTKDLPVGFYTIVFTAYDYAGNSTPATCEIEIAEADYTVIFNENRATTGTTTIATQTNTDVTMPADPFAAKYGFTFKEWNTKANGTGKSYPAGAVVRNLSTTHNSTVNLYAIWDRPDTLYLFNGGTPSGMKFTASPNGATATVGSNLYIDAAWYKFPSISSNVVDTTGYTTLHVSVSTARAYNCSASGSSTMTFGGTTFYSFSRSNCGLGFYYDSGEKTMNISGLTSGSFSMSAGVVGPTGKETDDGGYLKVSSIWLTK